MRHVIAPDEKYVCPEREPDFSSLRFAFSTFPPVGKLQQSRPAPPARVGFSSGSDCFAPFLHSHHHFNVVVIFTCLILMVVLLEAQEGPWSLSEVQG